MLSDILIKENGRFNMETPWAGGILTTKRPIAAKRHWLAAALCPTPPATCRCYM